jgi:hypothetical protein
VSVARHALSILLGRAPAKWVPPDFDLEDFTLPEELLVNLPSELVRGRPDILASEAQLHVASGGMRGDGAAISQHQSQRGLHERPLSWESAVNLASC